MENKSISNNQQYSESGNNIIAPQAQIITNDQTGGTNLGVNKTDLQRPATDFINVESRNIVTNKCPHTFNCDLDSIQQKGYSLPPKIIFETIVVISISSKFAINRLILYVEDKRVFWVEVSPASYMTFTDTKTKQYRYTQLETSLLSVTGRKNIRIFTTESVDNIESRIKFNWEGENWNLLN